MVNIADVYGSGELLKAADLQGRAPTVTIESVEAKQFNDGNKLIISFVDHTKKLVCNKTNAGRIAYMYGNETEDWVGKPVTLYSELVDFQGRTVEAIRIRPPHRQNGGAVRLRQEEAKPTRVRMPTQEDVDLEESIPF